MARTGDIILFEYAPSDKGGTVSANSSTITANGDQLCTGIIKLAQRWLLEFLTEKGSMPFSPDSGSSFISFAKAGRLATEVDIFSLFLLASAEVETNMLNIETSDDSADERFLSATLLRVDITNSGIKLAINIRSRAGSSRTIIAPINLQDVSEA